MELNGTNTLVAYFSHKGQNYSNGSIVNLQKGNTEVAAETIAGITGADLFEIVPENTYPNEYKECTDAAMTELRSGSRPRLASDVDISAYDVIILGYPCWWGTMPMPVFSFLESHDFSGKLVLPFCTHECSGMGVSEADLKKTIPGAAVKNGLPLHGSSVAKASAAVRKWLNNV